MVEHLSQRNLAQEDKIQELQETVETLEALHDMNEEIAENFRETELELKQELDMQAGQMRQVGLGRGIDVRGDYEGGKYG